MEKNMENQMEKNMENEMETLGPVKGVWRDATPNNGESRFNCFSPSVNPKH